MNKPSRFRSLPLLGAVLILPAAVNIEAGDRDWSYTYNATGQRLTANGPRDDVNDVVDITTYTYDTAGNRTSIKNALNHEVLLQNYNRPGQPELIIDANGVETVLTYHPRGWLLSSTVKHPGGNTALDAATIYTYDNEGQLITTTLPDGSQLTNEYDEAHRVKAIVNNMLDRIDYGPDAAGNYLTEVTTDSNSIEARRITRGYDELNRLIKLTGNDSPPQVTEYGYDPNGNRTSMLDGRLHTTTWQYDALDRLATTQAPLLHNVVNEYDDQDNVTKITDPNSFETLYTFNGLNDLKQIDSPDTGEVNFTYDPAGNRISKTDAEGIVTNFTYDAINRIKTIEYPADATRDVTYSYDNGGFCFYCNGRIRSIQDFSGTTHFFYDYLGNVVDRANDVALPGGGQIQLITSFKYDLAGNVTEITYPNGNIVNYVIDPIGRATKVTQKKDAATAAVDVAHSIGYDPFGPMTDLTFDSGLQLTRVFDLDGRFESQALSHGLQDLAYEYDATDNITEITNQNDTSRTETFSYDFLNRLEVATGLYGLFVYLYDPVGNRTQRQFLQNGQVTVEDYTYSATSNQLDSIDITVGVDLTQRSFQYDLNGNLVDETRANGTHRVITYDVTNRMESIGPTP